MAFGIVAVGTSLGGLRALRTILAGLPADFPLALAVVQHRPPEADDMLCSLLQASSRLPVCEVEDKDAVVAGAVHVAPANYHLLLDAGVFELSTDDKVLAARPSIDVLFEAVAASYGPTAIAVVLTGASADGAAGAASVKRRGGWLIVQEPAGAESRVMPEAALRAATADEILPLEQIAGALIRLSKAG
jgi:two-component system, chemotaxis family, protein-glutamate methylesterase/glutaminase